MICAEARLYAGAVADGQVDVVPGAVAEHLAGCAECSREVDWQRAGNLALAKALAEEAREDASRPPRPGMTRLRSRWNINALAATAVAAAVLVAVGIGAVLMSPATAPGTVTLPDSAMADAVHSFGATADYESSDVVAVNGWAGAHGAAAPAMTVRGASCVGARSRNVNGRQAVTYIYREGTGVVELSALPGDVPGDWPMSETRMMNGMAVGMVHHGNQGLIVVAGDEGSLMTFISQLP